MIANLEFQNIFLKLRRRDGEHLDVEEDTHHLGVDLYDSIL